MSPVGAIRYKEPVEVDDDVRCFIDGVTPVRRRRDAETLLALMHRREGKEE
jgi:hypothetical protein